MSLFREARTDHTDYTLVRQRRGVEIDPHFADGHSHDYINLATHTRKDLQFLARRVTLTRDGGKPPTYVGHGVVFIHVFEGEAVYRYGQTRLTLKTGDSISIDAELNHGFVEVVTRRIRFSVGSGGAALGVQSLLQKIASGRGAVDVVVVARIGSTRFDVERDELRAKIRRAMMAGRPALNCVKVIEAACVVPVSSRLCHGREIDIDPLPGRGCSPFTS